MELVHFCKEMLQSIILDPAEAKIGNESSSTFLVSLIFGYCKTLGEQLVDQSFAFLGNENATNFLFLFVGLLFLIVVMWLLHYTVSFFIKAFTLLLYVACSLVILVFITRSVLEKGFIAKPTLPQDELISETAFNMWG